MIEIREGGRAQPKMAPLNRLEEGGEIRFRLDAGQDRGFMNVIVEHKRKEGRKRDYGKSKIYVGLGRDSVLCGISRLC